MTKNRELIGNGGADSVRLGKVVKKEKLSKVRPKTEVDQQDEASERRVIRSKYLSLINKINDERDELSQGDSNRFSDIFGELEKLQKSVQKPREQIADGEALLDITDILVASVKSQSNSGCTPAEFLNRLVSEFGDLRKGLDSDKNQQIPMLWKNIGVAVCPIFRTFRGFSTMLGPMNVQMKQRSTSMSRKHARLIERVKPEKVDVKEEEKTDTDKNMTTMFAILKKETSVKIESLILNRKSYAQTVENLFALSFLVKDGRVEIKVDRTGSHFASPRNAPPAAAVMSGQVTYRHFVFRFDFKDWKLMLKVVPVGKELMPHRESFSNSDRKALKMEV